MQRNEPDLAVLRTRSNRIACRESKATSHTLPWEYAEWVGSPRSRVRLLKALGDGAAVACPMRSSYTTEDDTMHKRERYLMVCTKKRPEGHKKGSCAERGGEDLARALKSEALREGLDARVCKTSCFDLCWVGATVGIMPDMVFLKNLQLADVPTIVHALKTGGVQHAPELAAKIATAHDFVDPFVARGEPSDD